MAVKCENIYGENGVILDESERQRVEVWTRVMGYHRPVVAFNPGKQQEHRDRLHFNSHNL